jgi:hypothetical protein
MSAFDHYWRLYAVTLSRVREEKPDTFPALKAILDRFHPPSSGDAFFPDGADDTLADALRDAGWNFKYFGAPYVYKARHPLTSATLHYIEGDLYDRTRVILCSVCGDPLVPGCHDSLADLFDDPEEMDR